MKPDNLSRRETTMTIRIAVLTTIIIASPVWAGSGSLAVIAYTDHPCVATVLRQRADYAAMPVSISSEQGDPLQCLAEIRNAKRLIEKKAENNPDMVIHSGPATLSAKPASKLSFASSYSGGSSEADLYLLVPFKDKDRDVFTCASLMRTFLDGITFPGKVKLKTGPLQLAADHPEQYRPVLLGMIAADIMKTKDTLQAGGKARVTGLEGPVLVRRLDDENIELFINYQLSVEMTAGSK